MLPSPTAPATCDGDGLGDLVIAAANMANGTGRTYILYGVLVASIKSRLELLKRTRP